MLFFGGWGLDAHAVEQLNSGQAPAGSGCCDLLMVYDYRDLSDFPLQEVAGYDRVTVVAWSMGVWAASVFLTEHPLPVTEAIALNGTERPVHDQYGIPLRSYRLTEQRMDEAGRELFFNRMFAGAEEVRRFREQRPRRPLAEQLEELTAIRRQAALRYGASAWSRVYVSRADRIFPVANQLAWWGERVPVTLLEGGHYPFFRWNSWDELIRESTATV